MKLTPEFVRTVAVIIPVLVLAGIVEMRSLREKFADLSDNAEEFLNSEIQHFRRPPEDRHFAEHHEAVHRVIDTVRNLRIARLKIQLWWVVLTYAVIVDAGMLAWLAVPGAWDSWYWAALALLAVLSLALIVIIAPALVAYSSATVSAQSLIGRFASVISVGQAVRQLYVREEVDERAAGREMAALVNRVENEGGPDVAGVDGGARIAGQTAGEAGASGNDAAG